MSCPPIPPSYPPCCQVCGCSTCIYSVWCGGGGCSPHARNFNSVDDFPAATHHVPCLATPLRHNPPELTLPPHLSLSLSHARSEHRARVAKIDAAKQATMSLEDKAVADAALKHAREREEKQMALAKEMDAHRIAEEKRLREQHDHMRQAEQDALAAKRTLVQQKLEKRNEYVVEKRKAEAERKAIVEETEKIEAELRLEEAKKRQAQRDAEAAAAATAAAERKKVLTKMKMVGRLSAAAKKGKSLVPPTPSTPGDAGSDRTPLSSRLGGRQGSSAWSRRLQPDAASAVHLRDVKVRKHLVETEARRIQTIRVKVAAAGVIQRAWRLYIARRDNGELPPRPPRRPPSEQPQPRAKTPLRKPPLRYTVAADVKVGATAKSLHMTRAAPSLPPLRTNGAGNSTQRGANGPGRGGARRRRNTDKMHKIKLPDILSPEAMIKQAKAETSDTHVEVAALLIQLWWRRYKSRKRREKARLLRTGPGSEAVAALAEQRKKLVHIYAPTKPLVRVVARDRRYVTAHPSELRAARERRGQAVGAGGGGDGRKDSRTRSMPLATQMASMRLSQTLSPYQKVHAETVRQGAGHRGRKRNSMATVRLESLRPGTFRFRLSLVWCCVLFVSLSLSLISSLSPSRTLYCRSLVTGGAGSMAGNCCAVLHLPPPACAFHSYYSVASHFEVR